MRNHTVLAGACAGAFAGAAMSAGTANATAAWICSVFTGPKHFVNK